jgi:hypothetical protein
LAIENGYKLKDMVFLETSYFPSASALIDPIVEAAENAVTMGGAL